MSVNQLPLGTRDLISEEVYTKKMLKRKLESIFEHYGYTQVSTPLIEYYETYQNAFSNLNSSSLYKFLDQDGSILTLRMDMTVPVARFCASKYKEIKKPLRFYYMGNVYKVRQAFRARRNEVTDCGVELIGLDEQSDAEVLMCALDSMKNLEVEQYVLEIGNSRFFKKACTLLNLQDEVIHRLADLIDRKSLVDLQVYLESLSLNEKAKSFFLQLPCLNGDVSCLEQALALCFDESLKEEVQKLIYLRNLLEQCGYCKHIRFDLGKVPHLDYYTGIIFEGFVQGVGVSVLSGGRYDKLLSKFGFDVPACGFSVKLDYLLDVIAHKAEPTVKIYYPRNQIVEAIQTLRSMPNKKVELIPSDVESIVVKEEVA